MLKNVHLAPQWLVQLEKKLHSLSPHPTFRLFLTMEINPKVCNFVHLLPYSDKRKQLLKMTFLVNEQNVSVMYIDIKVINAISLYLDLNIFQQDEYFCSKLGMELEYAKSNLKTSLSQISVICLLLPFVRVGQISTSQCR